MKTCGVTLGSQWSHRKPRPSMSPGSDRKPINQQSGSEAVRHPRMAPIQSRAQSLLLESEWWGNVSEVITQFGGVGTRFIAFVELHECEGRNCQTGCTSPFHKCHKYRKCLTARFGCNFVFHSSFWNINCLINFIVSFYITNLRISENKFTLTGFCFKNGENVGRANTEVPSVPSVTDIFYFAVYFYFYIYWYFASIYIYSFI